jgi:hypothetical protein
MRRAADAATFNERQIMDHQPDIEQLRAALENLIYWADQAAPDLPDTVRIECLAYALDNARQTLKGQQ